MIVVKLFGITRDIVGSSSITIEENIKTVADLLFLLKTDYPRLKKLTSLLVAVDSNYASDETTLKDHQEVVLIPPVSGG